MSESGGPRAWRAVVLWPALAAAIVFANTLRNGFVYDDPIILEWLKTRRWDLEGFLLQTRGMTYAVHSLDDWLWGSQPAGYHFTNIVLHAAATSLAALCAFTLSRSRTVGIATGLFFAVHPVHVEVVANVSNRKDLLAMIFTLLGLLAWLRVGPRRARVALTAACYGLGLYSKEVAAAGLLPMLVLYDVWIGRSGPHGPPGPTEGQAPEHPPGLAQRLRRSLLDLSPLIVAGAVVTLVFARDIGSYFGTASISKLSDGHYRSYAESLATSCGNLVDVFRLLLLPYDLSIDYPIRPQPGLFSPRALAGFGILAGWLVLTVRVGRRSPLGGFALAWVLVTYLPCSNLVPLHHIHVAERYLYVPSFGWCLALGLALRSLMRTHPRSRRLQLAAAAALLVAAGFRSYLRNADWRNVPALIAAADRDGVDTWRIHKTAGSWALQNDEPEVAARRYARAAELRPGDPDLQFWRAVSAAQVGDLASAIRAGRATVTLRPHNTRAHYNLALALIQVGDLEQARAHLLRAIELEPEYAPAHYNLGVTLALLGDPDGARAAFRRCTEVQPEHAEAHFNLGTLQVERGQWDAGLQSLRRAVALDASNERFLDYLFSVSLKMDLPFAAIEAGELLARLQPERVELLEELGDLCARVGENRKAVAVYRQAIGVEHDDVRLLGKIALAAEALDQAEWAADAYLRILALEPDNEAARVALERVRGQLPENESR